MRSVIPIIGPLSFGLDFLRHQEDEYHTITHLVNVNRCSSYHLSLDKPIRYYHPLSSLFKTRPARPPWHKALIVGINYDLLSPADGWWSLTGPQKDALAFKDFLIRKYHFNTEDIVVMVDRPGEVDLAPTRANMLREIRNLVKDARCGDSFVFHFAGHSGQIVSEDTDEDDGMDEVLLPMDHDGLENKERLIVDNDLRKLLVDPLPVGARLTAIFDSCHSGTLLDLDHYECNEVYFPWSSKGPRKYRSKWVNVVRKNTLYPTSATGRIVQTKRVSKDEIQSRHCSVDLEPSRLGSRGQPGSRGRLSLSSKSKSIHSQHGELPSLAAVMGDITSGSPSITPDSQSPQTRAKGCKPPPIVTSVHPRIFDNVCLSPLPMVQRCEGTCEESPTEKPTVVSISACKDMQISWEGCDGASMTQILIKVLEEDPHPSFHDLMSKIGHSLHDIAVKLHEWSRGEYLRRKKKQARMARAKPAGGHDGQGCGTPSATTPDELIDGLEVNNFWDPQLGSQKPVKMTTERFTL